MSDQPHRRPIRRVALGAAIVLAVAGGAFATTLASTASGSPAASSTAVPSPAVPSPPASSTPITDPTPTAPTTPPRTVTGNGTGTVRGTPDTMTLQLGVSTRGTTVGQALTKNSGEAAQLVQVLRDAGVDPSDIQTSNFAISPEYDKDNRQIVAYTVTNSVTVTIRDLGKVGAIVDRATAVAADDIVVDSLYFALDDSSKLVATARVAAVKEAKDQAAQLAAAAGVELGDLQTITETSEPSPRPLAAGTARTPESAAPPIQPGSEELSVQVVVVYAIK